MNLIDDVQNLAPETLIGECIMPRLLIQEFALRSSYAEGVRRLVSEHRVGGFCVFGGDPDSVAATLLELQTVASESHGIPLLFSADCEFGLPMRLSHGGTEFPDAMAIARTGKSDFAFQVGRAIGAEMRSIGLHWNLAPVADVNSNPFNPIINTRSFGEEPEKVSQFVVEYIKGLHEAGIAATAKHFPGHGDTSIDSHQELPVIRRGIVEFEAVELPPFRAAIDCGVDSVMPGHLSTPKLTMELGGVEADSKLPATLSRVILQNLLRNRLGFQGLIVSDAMEMKAITERYGERQASVLAFNAGIDIVLLPVSPDRGYEALHDAFDSEEITASKIRESAARIFRLKRLVCSDKPFQSLLELEHTHKQLAATIAEQAIELRGAVDISNASLLILADDRPDTLRKAAIFQKLVERQFVGFELVPISVWASDRELTKSTVIATFHRARGYIDGSQSETTMDSVLGRIAEKFGMAGELPRGLIEFGSPYIDRPFRSQPSFIIKTFSESTASIEAVATMLR